MKRAASLICLVAIPSVFAQEDPGAHHLDGLSPKAARTAVPSPPKNRAADIYYDPLAMQRARIAMTRENGGMTFSQIMIDRAEYRLRPRRDAWYLEGEGWIGGDLNRLALRTKGEGEVGGKLDHGEVQALYSRAIDPWFNLEAGVRQDFGRTPDRTYAVLGIGGLAPYWFEVEGSVFLSDRGDMHARFEGSYDQRLTQRLILQPAAELNFSAQQVSGQRIGAGLSDVELGLRLRYEFARELAPYVGVNWKRGFGDTARFARVSGEDALSTSLVMGVRFWF